MPKARTFRSPDGPALFKEGHDDDSWRNYMVVIPDSKSAIIMLSGSENAEPMFPVVLKAVLDDRYSPTQ